MSHPKIYGWMLPEGDVHFADYLTHAPLWQGERRVYQPAHISHALKHTLKRRRVAIDVGAHIGFWSFFLAQKFEQVKAFEPVPEFIRCFEENVQLPNVARYDVALGNDNGWVDMRYVESNTGMSHILDNSITHAHFEPVTYEHPVRIQTLDFYGFKDVDLIKIDVEGYELEVLKGAVQTIKRHQPVIIIEQKYTGRSEQYAARDFLEGLGAVVLDRVVDDFIMGWPDDNDSNS